MNWYKENDTTAVIKFYGEIYQWWNNAKDFTDTFDFLNENFKEIKIRVHCYGGSVTEGNVIQFAIATAKAKVTVIIEGVAASMGSLCFLGASEIQMADNGFIMIHEPTVYVNGNAKQLTENANLLNKMTGNAVKSYTKKSGKSKAEFEKMMDGADHWLTADEALQLGLIDKVIPSVVDSVKDIKINDLVNENSFQSVFDRYAATLNDAATIPEVTPLHKQSNHQTQNQFQMKELLITMFGLANLTKDSSDTAIANALKENFDALNNKMKQLTTSMVTAAIASAEKTIGKEFTADQKTQFKAIGETSGIDALNNVLSFMQPAAVTVAAPGIEVKQPLVKDLITGEQKTVDGAAADPAKATWKFSEWLAKDNAGLMVMREKELDKYKALYKAEYGFEPEM
jgi:ATP-dependent protease ClpP protease subunit